MLPATGCVSQAQRLDVAPGEADAAVGQHVHRPGKRAVGVGEELIGERIIGRIGIQPLVYQKLSDTVVQAACGFGRPLAIRTALAATICVSSSSENWS